MKLRQFVSIMGVVALVALIYSPSSIGFSASGGGDGGTGPTDTSQSGTSMFYSYLRHSGYHVILANDSQQVVAGLSGKQGVIYMLVGPDKALSVQERNAVSARFTSGGSALISEGNTTNAPLLQSFAASTNGAPIFDPTSSFQDKRVFTVDLTLGSTTTKGLIDIASPLTASPSTLLSVVAKTSPSSNDSRNPSLGPRAVAMTGFSPSRNARIFIITDSAPFTNFLFNYTQPQQGVDEKAFVAAMVSWVAPAKNATILFDNAHYAGPTSPKFQAGLAIGPLVVFALEQNLEGLNSYYSAFPSTVGTYLGGMGIHVSDGLARALVAGLLLLSVYAAVTRWFAHEKKGRDDATPPKVERTIVAESRARVDFLQTSRSKGGYVATLAQLYEVLDSVVAREFGKGISALEESELAAKVGADEASRAKRLFLSLSKLHAYATGEKRFLLPPVLRWRALTARLTRDAEAFLNRLGMTIAGEEAGEKEKVEVLMRGRARA
jgi:hypothetical protein